MNTITRAEALQMLADAFDEPIKNITPDTERDSLAGWDSMGALTLMAELDERFSIVLTAEQSAEMKHIRDVLALLQSHGALSD